MLTTKQSLIPKIRRIRELEVTICSGLINDRLLDFSTLSELENLSLTHMQFSWFPPLPQSIQTLNISSRHIDGLDGVAEHAKLHKLSKLVMGTFEPGDLSVHVLHALLEPNKGNLILLDITSCPGISSEDMKRLTTLGYFSRLEELHIADNAHVDDDLAEFLAANLSFLRVLNISCTGVTGVGVKALVEKPGTKLQRLYLRLCHSVSIDAVEYARSRGVWVKFEFPDPRGSKKRIRSA